MLNIICFVLLLLLMLILCMYRCVYSPLQFPLAFFGSKKRKERKHTWETSEFHCIHTLRSPIFHGEILDLKVLFFLLFFPLLEDLSDCSGGLNKVMFKKKHKKQDKYSLLLPLNAVLP